MSASKKMTDRQAAEQKEAKQVKLYTIAFVVILVAFIAIAIYSGVSNQIANSGVHERNTIAATVGDHQVSNAELNYFYTEVANQLTSNYGITIDDSMVDYLISSAVSSAQETYAMVDAAKAEGYTLSSDMQEQLSTLSANLDMYATSYGFGNTDAYVKAQFGNGATKQTYIDYVTNRMLASEYQTAHQESLTFSAEQIQEADKAVPGKYSNYNYNQYILNVSSFLTGGTTAEDGTVTYSAEEKAAAVKAAEEAAATLTAEGINSVETLDAAIAALDKKEGMSAASTPITNQAYSNVKAELVDWMVDASRKEGDVTSATVTAKSTDDTGAEVEEVTAIYVALFNSVNTNETKLANVRHILVGFEGEANEDGTYSDEIKSAAKASAEEILESWKSGDATEESFAALANEKSTDGGSNTNGGLYENVYPGQMVTAFNDWCFDASRAAGDTGIVETDFGYHVMYFVGSADQTYRDYRITNDLRSEAMQTWYNELIEKTPVVNGDTSYIHTGV